MSDRLKPNWLLDLAMLPISAVMFFPFCLWIFYFTHPDRGAAVTGQREQSYRARRSSIQAARLDVVDGLLTCDRDAPFEMHLRPEA